MQIIQPDLINKFNGLLPTAWEKAAETFLANSNQEMIATANPPELLNPNDILSDLAAPMLSIQFAFSSLPKGYQALLLPSADALALAGVVTGTEFTTFDESVAEMLSPLFAPMVETLSNELAEFAGMTATPLDFAISSQPFSYPPNFLQQEELVRTTITCSVAEVNLTFTWLIDGDTFSGLIPLATETSGNELESGDPFQQLQADNSENEMPQSAPLAAPVFAQAANEDETGIELLLDIPLEVSVELGRVKMLIRDVVDLGTGSIIELDKTVGEPVEVLVNGRLVARGEVVVLEDNFGVRITEILNTTERLKSLAERD